jgi:hypothetical protein
MSTVTNTAIQHETFIQKVEELAERFGEWVAQEFHSASNLYNELSDLEKKGATWAYGVIAIVNKNLDKDAVVILPIIQKAFPDLSIDVLHGFVDTVLNDLNAVQSNVPVTLEDALNALVKYLGTFKGNAWAQVSQSLGNLLAIAFSPETPIQKFIQVAELVYQVVVKPLLDL